jgi:hypothetical protein
MTKANHDPTSPAATPSPSPSRRIMLTGASAALLAGTTAITAAHGAPAAPAGGDGADAELLALCAAFHAKNATVIALSDAANTNDEFDRMAAAQVERYGIEAKILARPTATIAGHTAKAAVAVALFEESQGECPDADVAFAWAVLRDIVGRGVA